MAKQDLVRTSCINHPERPSTIRCRRCNVPICNKCKVVTAHGVYCSETCAEQMAAFLKKAASLDGPAVRKGRRMLRFSGRFIVLVAVVASAWYLLRMGIPQAVWAWLMSFLRTVQGG